MTEPGQSSAPTHSGTPKHLWIVGVLALLWNLVGALEYLAIQMRWEFYVSELPEAHLAFLDGMPAWAISGWALAVWLGLVGAIGLLMRRAWAVWMFLVSLIGLALSTLYSYALSEGGELMGTTGLLFTLLIWVISIFLLLYARRQAQNGVLG